MRPMATSKADWEAIERDFRAGLQSVREIAANHDISHTAINKRAREQNWVRDLAAKIQAKAEALVSKEVVSAEVSAAKVETERITIEANARAIADIRLAHRSDIGRNKRLALKLLAELESITDNGELFDNLGELLANPDDRGIDKLRDLYQKVVDLPQRIKGTKELADTLKTLIGLEREAWGLAAVAEKPPEPETFDKVETARRLAFILMQGVQAKATT